MGKKDKPMEQSAADGHSAVPQADLEHFFEDSAIALHLVGADGTILRANKAELAMLGYSAEEYVGHHIAEFHVDQDAIKDILTRLERGETLVNHPARLRARDGSIKHVEITSSGRFKNADFVHTGCFTVDVTERELIRASAAKRDTELTALYRLAEKLHQAGTLDAVYEAASNALERATGCDRLAILLFDGSGEMRFVAWRGLSKHYRGAVEGHSPWTPETKLPEPICVKDLDTAEMAEPLKHSIRREGIRSLAFVPLVVHGRLIGKVMIYYDRQHEFTEEEVDLALATARQVALAVDRVHAEEARHHAEQELRRNEERLRLATETADIGIWEWDITAGNVSWSDAHYAIHGFKAGEFEPTVDDFMAQVHPDDQELVSRSIAHTLEEDAPYELEFRLVRPDGEVAWIYTRAFVVREGGRPVRLIGAAIDITQRKQAEEKFRVAVEAAPSGMILIDQQGRIELVNREAERLFGYDRDELMGQSVETLIPERFRSKHPGFRTEFGQKPETRAMGAGRDLHAVRKDGTEVPVEIGLSPLRTEYGLFVLSAIVDITERKRAEARDKMLVREVEHRGKNLLSLVQSIIRRSLAGDPALAQARQAISSRLTSLAHTHQKLTETDWNGLDLAELVRSELAPFGNRVVLNGPDVTLDPQRAQNLALALHELATNAAKYGALSSTRGQVAVSWSLDSRSSGPVLGFRWTERGGPPVAAPTRDGFGTTLLMSVFGDARFDYAEEMCPWMAPLTLRLNTAMLDLGSRSKGPERPVACLWRE